jgi:hypothetical protein
VSERPQNKHLKPFKKGDDPRRSKKGRQKFPDIKELLEALGDDGMEAVIKALHTQAKKGNVKAIQEVLDRYYGKVKQDIGIEGEITTNIINLGGGQKPE